MAEAADYSLLQRPVPSNQTGVRQIIECFTAGTEDIKRLLLHEADVILECRVCRSLYRGLLNFVSHKQEYCAMTFSEYEQQRLGMSGTGSYFMDTPMVPKTEASTETSITDSLLQGESLVVVLPEPPPDDPQPIVGSAAENYSIEFQSITGTSQAVYQRVTRPKFVAGSTPNGRSPENTSRTSKFAKISPPECTTSDYDPIRAYCRLCDKTFSSRRNVRRHMVEVHKKTLPGRTIIPSKSGDFDLDKLICRLCKKTFISKQSIRRHMVEHHGKSLEIEPSTGTEQKTTSPSSSTSSKSEEEHERDTKKGEKNDDDDDDDNDGKEEEEKEKEDHAENDKDDDSSSDSDDEDDDDDEDSDKDNDEDNDAESVEGSKDLKVKQNVCQHCDKGFSTKDNWKKHMVEVHGLDPDGDDLDKDSDEEDDDDDDDDDEDKDQTTPSRPPSTSSSGSPKLRSSYDMDRKCCIVCDRYFTTKRNLIRHMVDVHKRPMSQFKIGAEYDKLLSHCDLKRKMCLICKKVFASKRNTKRHMVDVHKQQPSVKLQKDNGPESSGSEPSTPTEEKPAGKTTKLQASYDLEKKECLICKRKFSRQLNLLQHMNAHGRPVKFFRCPFCAYETREKRHVLRHAGSVHKKGPKDLQKIHTSLKTRAVMRMIGPDGKVKPMVQPSSKSDPENENEENAPATGNEVKISEALTLHKCNVCKRAFANKGTYCKHMKWMHGRNIKQEENSAKKEEQTNSSTKKEKDGHEKQNSTSQSAGSKKSGTGVATKQEENSVKKEEQTNSSTKKDKDTHEKPSITNQSAVSKKYGTGVTKIMDVPNLKCLKCNKKFSGPQVLQRHVRLHMSQD
ncbi:zinc finger protein 800-like [Branchiostoma lanceolatum]|uniref:zinc finger protein 800-like n=1 Tax=Branchiostoma lanceolatum TaxID=7740 RepID=UPI00345245BF